MPHGLEMARALGILHTPVEVAALGYDWVAGSLQADVALEELYGLYLFVAGLTTRHVVTARTVALSVHSHRHL